MQDAETDIFIVNTCVRYMPEGWADMIHNSRAAAWGDRAIGIERITINSVVYLYHSGTGVIAKGITTTKSSNMRYMRTKMTGSVLLTWSLSGAMSKKNGMISQYLHGKSMQN